MSTTESEITLELGPPLPVLDLAWDLEEYVFEVTTGEDGTLPIKPRHSLDASLTVSQHSSSNGRFGCPRCFFSVITGLFGRPTGL